MSRYIFFLFCMSFSVAVWGQQDKYAEALKRGDEALRAGKYNDADKNYKAALVYDPTKRDVINSKMQGVDDAAENAAKILRNSAIKEVTRKLSTYNQNSNDCDYQAIISRMRDSLAKENNIPAKQLASLDNVAAAV